ncbi:hypothetical protein [Aneurinibacillus danicus]|uniref:hypothetical protein n=1 Tax=Aneurinibacillus danicus TaxID=267746 RepID=UPI0011BFAFEF|nr:hypothetical protein [Aneurinibacillus danicus]
MDRRSTPAATNAATTSKSKHRPMRERSHHVRDGTAHDHNISIVEAEKVACEIHPGRSSFPRLAGTRK